MRRVPLSFAAVALASLAFGAAPLAAQEPPAEAVLVTFTSPAAMDRALDDGALEQADEGAEPVAGRVADAELTPAEQGELAATPGVLAVEPDVEVFAADVPNDPCYTMPGCGPAGAYHVDQIGLPAAWDLTHGAGTVVAVIDSGVANVPELAGKLLPEIDVTGGPGCTSGVAQHHGTQVASVIAANTDDLIGIPGVGWSALVRPVRVWAGSSCGGTSLSYVVNGIAAAHNSGARILNLSLTTDAPSTALRSVIDDVVAGGSVVIAAAGNSDSGGTDVPMYPAAFPGVISVGASCPTSTPVPSCSGSDPRASFSHYGSTVDVFAPGVVLPAYNRLGVLGSFSGTSAASPVVAGVVALMRTLRPGLTPAQVADVLVRSADPVGSLLRLDARGALYDSTFGAQPPVGASGHVVDAGTTLVAARGNDGRPMVRSASSGDSPWTALDGLLQGTPDLATVGGATFMVGRGVDNRAYLRARQGSSWSAWTNLGGGFTTDLSIAASPGRVDVFGRGLDGAIWTGTFNGSTFGGWSSLGGNLSSEPDATSWGPGRLDVFARGLDGAMWHRAFEGGWMPWESLGGGFTTGPGAASLSAGVLHVAGVGLDGHVYLKAWGPGGYTGWVSLGGALVASPDLAVGPGGILDVHARAADQQIWRYSFGRGGTPGWVQFS